jgi:hypothetical protein
MRLEVLLLLWAAVALIFYVADPIISRPADNLKTVIESIGVLDNQRYSPDSEIGVRADNLGDNEKVQHNRGEPKELFPVPVAVVEEPKLEPEAVMTPQESAKLFLHGLVKRGDKYMALVRTEKDGQYHLVEDSQQVGGYRILRVLEDKILVESIVSREQRHVGLRGEGEASQ